MKNLFYLIILTFMFVTSAMAQGIEEPTAEPVSMTKLTLSGVQSAVGTVDTVNDMRVGNTFALNGADENISYHLTMSMDYSAANPDMVIGNRIVSGTWTVTVYKNDVYFGVMFGNISGGGIIWATNQNSNQYAEVPINGDRYTEAQFTITGGLDGYAGQSPMILEKSLVGDSKFSEKGQPTIDATVELPLVSER